MRSSELHVHLALSAAILASAAGDNASNPCVVSLPISAPVAVIVPARSVAVKVNWIRTEPGEARSPCRVISAGPLSPVARHSNRAGS
jgi:hypothetical protein